jgi:crotonobetaine/carnitine-CoA ligase
VTTTEGEALTFGEAAADAARVAGWLEALGVERGDTIAVMMGSTLDFIRVWLGLQYRGAVGVLLNTELSGAFLEHQLANCGCTFAIADATLAPRVGAAAPQAPHLIHHVVLCVFCVAYVYSLLFCVLFWLRLGEFYF